MQFFHLRAIAKQSASRSPSQAELGSRQIVLIKNKSVRTTMRLKWAFWDILGHFGTFWDNSEDFLTSLDLLDGFPSHFRPFSPIIGSDIFRHFLTFWDILRHFGTFRDNSEDILTSWDHLDCFPSHFRPFSPVIGSLKKTRSGRTD